MHTKIILGGFFLAMVPLWILLSNGAAFAQITSKAQWDSAFNTHYSNGDPILDVTNGEESGMFAWHAHFWVRAYLSMAQTFNDNTYLDIAVTLIDHMLYYRDDKRYARGEIDIISEPYVMAPLYYLNHRNEAAPGWRRIWAGELRIEVVTDGQITQAIMWFVDMVYNKPQYAAYQAKAEEYIARVEETVEMHNTSFVFNRFPDVPGSYYYPNPNGSGLYSGGVPYNQCATMGVTLLLLDKVKGGVPPYREMADSLISYFRVYAEVNNNNAYVWDYFFRANNPGPEDFNHGHIDLCFMNLAYKRGLDLSAADMERFVNTLTENIYQGNATLAWYVDGSNNSSQNDYWSVAFNWIDLAEFDPQVLDIANEYYNAHYTNPSWAQPFLGWAELLRWNNQTGGGSNLPPATPENLRVEN